MPVAKIQGFGGMLPAVDPRLLPDELAVDSQNVWFYNGSIQGIVQEVNVQTIDPTTRSVFRIPKAGTDFTSFANSWWLEFTQQNISVVKSPVVDSQDPAVYWASDTGVPMYTTLSRIVAGNPALVLGIPTPEVAPGVAPSGGVGATETRAYVYTWVSSYGEEGPPSPPTTVTGKVDDTWAITMTAPTLGDTTDRALDKTRIYRTVTASTGVATFFFVTEVPIATLAYNDTISDDVVTASGQLESTTWTGPPDLVGLAALPNGMLAGWTDNEIWFCEPYRPHAWPVQYQLHTEYPIVAMVGSGQSLLIGTEGYPYFATGVSPDNIVLTRVPEAEPCVSRTSMVPGQFGAWYSSPSGLIFFAAAGTIVNKTRETIPKDSWQELMTLNQIRAAELNGAYFAYCGTQEAAFDPGSFDNDSFQTVSDVGVRRGLLIEALIPHVGLTRLLNNKTVYNVYQDPWTGEVLLITAGAVYWLDLKGLTQQAYTWTSKIFSLPYPQNLGAAKIQYDPPPDGSTPSGTISTYAWNNGEPAKLWQQRAIPQSNKVFRLPAGFLADSYQFVITGNLQVKSLQFAATVTELQKV